LVLTYYIWDNLVSRALQSWLFLKMTAKCVLSLFSSTQLCIACTRTFFLPDEARPCFVNVAHNVLMFTWSILNVTSVQISGFRNLTSYLIRFCNKIAMWVTLVLFRYW
jgi:hypothetical protein